jgi:hypothetical protein
MDSRNVALGICKGITLEDLTDNRGIDVYTAQGELINHFSDPETAIPAVVQFHPRKDWIVGGTARGRIVAFGLPESAD